MTMSEPTLKEMEDYKKLSGEKRRVVIAVILSGLIVGGIFAIAKSVYGSPDDEVKTGEKIGKIPLK